MLQITPLSRFLVNIDHACDHVPFVNTLINAIDICMIVFQQCVLSSSWTSNETKKSLKDSYYFNYLNYDKELSGCFLFLMPVFGNIAKGMSQNTHYKLSEHSPSYRTDNKFFIYDLIKRNPRDFQFAGTALKNDEDFLCDAISAQYQLIHFIDLTFLKNEKFMLKIIKNNPEAVGVFLPTNFSTLENFYSEAVRVNNQAIDYISKQHFAADPFFLYRVLTANKNASFPKSSDENLKDNTLSVARFYRDTKFINTFQLKNLPKIKDEKSWFKDLSYNPLFNSLPPELKRQIFFDYQVISFKEEFELVVDFNKSVHLNCDFQHLDLSKIFKGNNLVKLEEDIDGIRKKWLPGLRTFSSMTLNQCEKTYPQTKPIVFKNPQFFQELFQIADILIDTSCSI